MPIYRPIFKTILPGLQSKFIQYHTHMFPDFQLLYESYMAVEYSTAAHASLWGLYQFVFSCRSNMKFWCTSGHWASSLAPQSILFEADTVSSSRVCIVDFPCCTLYVLLMLVFLLQKHSLCYVSTKVILRMLHNRGLMACRKIQVIIMIHMLLQTWTKISFLRTFAMYQWTNIIPFWLPDSLKLFNQDSPSYLIFLFFMCFKLWRS